VVSGWYIDDIISSGSTKQFVRGRREGGRLRVEQGLLHERGNSAKATGLYLVASSHGGMDRIDNCCKYNATNWSRMSVSKKTKNVCFVLFSVPAS